MPTSTLSLKEFTKPVAYAEPTTRLADALEILRSSGCDTLVVVSKPRHPLGVINLHNLLIDLLPPHPGQAQAIDVQAPLSELQSPHIETLAILSAQLPLSQFWSEVQNRPELATNQAWGIVNPDGSIVGLLDSKRLLQYLAKTERDRSPIATPAIEEGESSPIPLLNPLTQLLEQLPLPLMLHTSTGQLLTRNRLWRQEIGLIPELEWLDRQAAEVNLTPLESSAKEGYEAAEPLEPPYGMRDDAPTATTSRLRVMTSVSRLTPTSSPTYWEASAVISDTQNPIGKRTWQFVKVPLSDWVAKQASQFSLPLSPNSPSLTPDLYLVMATDITEQQQLAKELAAKNADLVQLNRFKDEFLACISHELKTPLTAVLGLSQLLKEQMLGKLNDRQARYARLIHESGRQLMGVVNDILDLTRMETGQLKLTLEPVQIRQVCDRAYTQALQRLTEKDSHSQHSPIDTPFTLEVEPGLESIVADELRLRQILVHLLSNAIKFTDLGGKTGLKVSRWQGWIAFTVWDTGLGIPPEKQHLIFQKFQQLENPLNRRFEGTGLGLVLAQRLAHLHGGDVSFVSQIDKGSEFTLLLPPCPPPLAVTPEANGDRKRANHRLSSSSSNRLVLIVEAVPQYIEQLTQQLKNLGYWVVVARSGTEAIEKGRQLQPCAILLNPLLPLLSGWDVLTLFKSDPQTRHIPILVTATQAEKQRAHQNKADGFLSLPVREDALLQSLNRITKHQPSLQNSLTILYLTNGDSKTPYLSRTSTEPVAVGVTEVGEAVAPTLQYDNRTDLYEALDHQPSPLSSHCRVLEADDLEQAELLARVWHPDVVVLENVGRFDPVSYLEQLSQYSGLASLPLVTLDYQTTEAANHVTGLSVFPCLAPNDQQKTSALLQVIQVAAGISWQPSILVLEAGTLPVSIPTLECDLLPENLELSDRQPSCTTLDNFHPASEWLQALTHYLQTAGYRSSLSRSWAEVSHQLQEQNVDLLLIDLKDTPTHPDLLEELISLIQLPKRPPILVLDRRLDAQPLVLAKATPSSPELEPLLNAVATQILRGHSQSMAELLEVIKQMLN
jgi:signal transduction histidine kinase/DNA-binding response OmpR family regulator